MSNNSIKSFTWLIDDNKVVYIDLQFNNISNLISEAVDVYKNIYEPNDDIFFKFDLRNNNLTSFTASGNIPFGNYLRYQFLISDNNFACDCEMIDRIGYPMNSANFGFFDHENETCKSPPYMVGRKIMNIKEENLMCENEICVENCTCLTRPSDKTLIVNCTQRGLETLVEFSSNLANKPMTTELMLQHNNLRKLPNIMYQRSLQVTAINASHNRIESISYENLKIGLLRLDLSYNQLTMITSDVLQMFAMILILNIAYNPWFCDCKAAEFLGHVKNFNHSIRDYQQISCEDGRLFGNIEIDDICFKTVYILAILGVILGFIGLVFATFYRYKKNIKIWLYNHNMCMWFVTEKEIDEDKIYDAFVVFATPDQSLVEDLVEGLESAKNRFTCCMGLRDWPPGKSLIDLVNVLIMFLVISD